MAKPLPLLVTCLLIAGCTSEGSGTITTSNLAGETTSDRGAGTTTTSEAPAASAGEDCLVGSWVLDNEAFAEEMRRVFADAGMSAAEVTPLDGTFTMTFEGDGTLSAERQGWGWDIGVEGSTVRIEINGTESGTWSLDGSTLTVETDFSDVVADSSIVVDGQVLEIPEGFPVPEVPTELSAQSEIDCEDEVLTLTSEDVTSRLERP